MTALDWFLSFIGIAGFAIFVGIVAWFVPAPALVAVIVISVGMAAFDFWVWPFLKRR